MQLTALPMLVGWVSISGSGMISVLHELATTEAPSRQIRGDVIVHFVSCYYTHFTERNRVDVCNT